MQTLEELDEYEEELRDRFGPPPNEVKNLLAETRIRCLCGEAGFDQLEVKEANYFAGLSGKRRTKRRNTFA